MDELRERALRLLARREHARGELRRKLAAHAESEAALDAVLDELEARRLLSDARYAEMRVSVRSARYGNARLTQELRSHGVDAGLAEKAIAAAGDELTRAHAIWLRKFGKLPAEAAERAKQTRYLLNRGFSGEIVRRVLRGDGYEQEEE